MTIIFRFFYIALIVWGIGIELYTNHPYIALKVIPLLLCLYGVIRVNVYVLQWAIIILHLYLFEGLVSLTSSKYPYNLYGLITLLLSLLAYIPSLVYIYPIKKQAKKNKI